MSSKGNLAWQMRGMEPARPANSTVQCIFRTQDGILLGYSNITTAAALELITNGSLGAGCVVFNAVGSAVNTIQMMCNEGTSTAPVFTCVMSVGGIDPDA